MCPITSCREAPRTIASLVPVWIWHSVRCSRAASDTNSLSVGRGEKKKASMGVCAFVESATVWRVMYIWSHCGSGAERQVSKRQASVCRVSCPPALRYKAERQLGHYHRLTFASALPTAHFSDIQGRCGGGRKGVACWVVGVLFACSVLCVFLQQINGQLCARFCFVFPNIISLCCHRSAFETLLTKRLLYLIFSFPPHQTCLLSKRLLLSFCEILASW